MRKILPVLLAMAVLLGLAACGDKDNGGGGYEYESSPILLDRKYFNVDEPEISIVFHQDGTFALEGSDGVSTGDYAIDGGIITVEDSRFEIVTFDVLKGMGGNLFTIEGNLSEFGAQAPVEKTGNAPATEIGNTPTLVIDGKELDLPLKTFDGVVYAGGAFAESLTSAGRQEFICEFDAAENVIYIISWATDVPIYKLHIGSTTAERLEDDYEGTFADVAMGAAPLLRGGEVWLPVEAFAALTGHGVSID